MDTQMRTASCGCKGYGNEITERCQELVSMQRANSGRDGRMLGSFSKETSVLSDQIKAHRKMAFDEIAAQEETPAV